MPFEPDVIVIQDAPLDAVQAQPDSVVTETVPVDAAADTDVALGVVVYVQPPLWVTVNVSPAIVSVPVRWLEEALAVTE